MLTVYNKMTGAEVAFTMTPRATDTLEVRIARLVTASLLTDARWNNAPQGVRPRGYWADPGKGSTLWQLRHNPPTGAPQARLDVIKGAVESALAWLRDSGVASFRVMPYALAEGYGADIEVTTPDGSVTLNVPGMLPNA
jgi:phage gp46-like protein